MAAPEQLEQLPAELAALLDAVPTAGDRLHTPAQRSAWLVGLRRLIDRCEAEFLAVLGQFDAHGDGEVLTGAPHTIAWCKSVLKLAAGDAHTRVLAARQAHHDLATTITLLRDGVVTYDQTRAIGQALRPLPDHTKPAAADILNQLASTADAGTVRAVGRTIRATVDPDGALTTADKNFTRRALYLSPMLDGMTAINGILDPHATTTLTTALAPFLTPAGPDDDRTPPQRRADGLTDLARLTLDHTLLGQVGGNPPRLEVTVPLATMTALTSPPGPPTPPGHPPAQWLNPLGQAPPLTHPDLHQISCHATIARVILGPNSVPTDYGRDHRLFTPTQRKALATRDHHCRFPHCHRPPAHTDAHHLQSWLHGGTTDLTNGLLLCRYHHRAIHRGTWTITPNHPEHGANSTLTFTGPLHQQLTSHPPTGPPGTC